MSDTQSTVTLQGINRFTGENSDPVKPLPDLIEQYRASERGDLRAMAAIAAETPLVVIEPNGAPFPVNVLPPQIVTATDDGARIDYAPVQSPPLFDAIRASRIGKAMIRTLREVARAGAFRGSSLPPSSSGARLSPSLAPEPSILTAPTEPRGANPATAATATQPLDRALAFGGNLRSKSDGISNTIFLP